jgi:deazaflavin-dependent oxidoreductase (nitroreductase family)
LSSDASYWHRTNKRVIDEFRANDGELKSRKWPVILLTTTGAKTGRKHVTPLNFSRDGDDLVVIASKGGSSTHPDWDRNLVANPEVEIEDGASRFRAKAVVAKEPRRTRLYDAQAKVMTFFDGYRKRVTSREIPVVVFTRMADEP